MDCGFESPYQIELIKVTVETKSGSGLSLGCIFVKCSQKATDLDWPHLRERLCKGFCCAMIETVVNSINGEWQLCPIFPYHPAVSWLPSLDESFFGPCIRLNFGWKCCVRGQRAMHVEANGLKSGKEQKENEWASVKSGIHRIHTTRHNPRVRGRVYFNKISYFIKNVNDTRAIERLPTFQLTLKNDRKVWLTIFNAA